MVKKKLKQTKPKSKSPKTIGIVTKHLDEDVVSIAKKVKKYLEKKGAKVVVETSLAEKIKAKSTFDLNKIKADLVITVGGDGTILATEQSLGSNEIPILGINKGYLGFLTELGPDFEKGIDELLKGNFEVEERIKLDISLNDKYIGSVLNDAVLMSSKPAKIQRYKIFLDEREVDEFAADGIIVATPNGSTAYAMSAGGPILDPAIDALEIVPISPFRLSVRPIVIPPKTVVHLHVTSERPAILILDGYDHYDVTHEDHIELQKSKEKAYFVKFEKNFYKKVKGKLV